MTRTVTAHTCISQRHFGGKPELPFCSPDLTHQGQVLELRGKKSPATNGVTQSGKGRLTNRCSVAWRTNCTVKFQRR